jgi:hypothetical protein
MGSIGMEMALSKNFFFQADYSHQIQTDDRQSGFASTIRYEF